jgi:hypothetical protein
MANGRKLRLVAGYPKFIASYNAISILFYSHITILDIINRATFIQNTFLRLESASVFSWNLLILDRVGTQTD